MSKKYPIMLTEDKLPEMFSKLSKAGVPKKFTYRFLASLGFASSNDRPFVDLLKDLGFLDDSGVPTSYYLQLRDKNTIKNVLAERVKHHYNDLFTVDTKIYEAPAAFVQNVFSNLTSQDEQTNMQMTRTFLRLCSLADFSTPQNNTALPKAESSKDINGNISYNINITLPETTDTKVYEAIFNVLSKFKNLSL